MKYKWIKKTNTKTSLYATRIGEEEELCLCGKVFFRGDDGKWAWKQSFFVKSMSIEVIQIIQKKLKKLNNQKGDTLE